MSDTRPPNSDPASIAKWAAEKTLLERRASDETEFRITVLVQLRELGVKMENVQDTLIAHVKEDDDRIIDIYRRFGSITQSIGDGRSRIAWILGAGAGALAMSGIAMWVIGRAVQ